MQIAKFLLTDLLRQQLFLGKLVCGKNRVCDLEEDPYSLDNIKSEIQLRTNISLELPKNFLFLSGDIGRCHRNAWAQHLFC